MKYILYIAIYLFLKLVLINGCKTNSGSQTSTSSPAFTYTFPSEGQILVIKNPTYVFKNDQFTFFVLILTELNAEFCLIIDFGDQNNLTLNTTQKQIAINKTYHQTGLFLINVSVIEPFLINDTKTIFVIKSNLTYKIPIHLFKYCLK